MAKQKISKQKIENVKNDIRIWKKNEQAFCDLAGLVYELKRNDYEEDISTATLFYRVLNNLEDPEIWIDYKGDSLIKLFNNVINKIYNLEAEYSQIFPESLSTLFKEIRSKNIDEYLFKSRLVDRDNNRIKWFDEPYNIVTLLKYKISWIRELLISRIPKATRIQMLDDIIKSNEISLDDLVDDSNYPDSVYPVLYTKIDDDTEAKKRTIEEVKQLFSDWAKETIHSIDDIYNMMSKMQINKLAFLQRNDIINFAKVATYSSAYGTVGAPAQIFRRDPQNLSALIDFYEYESFQELDEKIRQNTDKLLINDLVNCSFYDLLGFMKSKSFQISDEIIDELISASSSKNRNLIDLEINQICETIERKAQTPKEYRKFKQYTSLIRNCLNPVKIEQQRKELVLRLKNMDESLQEQVPGKMALKNIKFRVYNK